jgi:hypothetical protein
VSPRRCDTYGFYDFDDFEQLAPESRALIAVGAEDIGEMQSHRVVMGHFRLATLLTLAPPSSIATVLREPRARLLSLYSFARSSSTLTAMWRPYPDERSSGTHAKRPLNDYLSEPLVAYDTDNGICRLLLDGDARIPPMDFIAPSEVEGLAAAAIEKLETLGFVGFLELAERMWAGLEAFFGLTLARVEMNLSGPTPWQISSELAGREPITDRTLELLEDRTAADALVYAAALRSAGLEPSEVGRLRDVALAEQLVRFGELTAGDATQVQAAQQELDRHREWLRGIQGSASWRMTAPLRAAKRLVRFARD